MSNFNWGNEIICLAKYVLVLNCNYSELHINCGKGSWESKAMFNFICDDEIFRPNNWLQLMWGLEENCCGYKILNSGLCNNYYFVDSKEIIMLKLKV